MYGKITTTKPLSKVSSILNEDISRILIIDDKIENFGDNPFNGILISKYNPSSIVKDDTAFLDIMKWLETPEVLEIEDVRDLSPPTF